MQAAEREIYARDYLFKPAKQKNTNTLLKAWGITDTKAPLATSVSSRTRAKAAEPVSKANQLFMDMMLVNATKRKPTKK
jgi:hypothetical protein